ncbi:nucleoid-structuring protein H-NS [Mycobacterium uberis]|uniref:Nucleoid-structuring protein H-NS n=1 Tax=Mycobacterium uberis TaxID=2162698 RepID=A0A3E1HLL3_9MYCO|nr:nucleoid-structuring protein H-NS [Mycobacterium uberis]RFD27179.1 nucleoid-structuring protein H-NS [Mycobacterium uberis]
MPDPHNPPNSESDGALIPPVKNAPAQTAKASPQKAPVKKAPSKNPCPTPPQTAGQPFGLQQRIETNGQLDAVKNTAAQAKSAVEDAGNPVTGGAEASETKNSPAVLVIALALGLLALLLIRQLRRR